MGSTSTLLTTWDEFIQIPDASNASHFELHDGEIVLVPPPQAIHFFIQTWLTHWLTAAAAGRGRAAQEFPYRPAANLQFWKADVAYAPEADWKRLLGAEYPIYAPPLIIEVLSLSNKASRIDRQRIAAFSAGTHEFWLGDANSQTIEVSIPGSPAHVYKICDTVPISLLPGTVLPVKELFAATQQA